MRVLAIVLALLFSVSCVSAKLPKNASAEHGYYAAVADYNQAKRIMVEYLDEVPQSVAEEVLKIVLKTDKALKYFERVRRGECDVCAVLTDLDFENKASALRSVASALRKLIGE